MNQAKLRFIVTRAALWSAVILIAPTSGCSLLPTKRAEPEAQLRSMHREQKGTPEGVIPTDLQAEVMTYADRYTLTLAQSIDNLVPQLDTPEARAQAQSYKADQASAAIFVASEPKPLDSLLDMVVLVTLGRLAAEETWGDKSEGGNPHPALESCRQLEKEAWALAGRHLGPQDVETLKGAIRSWYQHHPDRIAVSTTRFRDIALARQGLTTPHSNQLARLLDLDPLQGLNVASRATEEARLLGRQAMYYGQRIPLVIQWRTELLTSHLAQGPELRQTFALSANLAKTTEQLPGLISQEREAAIKQMFGELARMQSNLVAQLTSQQERLGSLLTNAQATLSAGTEAAGAANDLAETTTGLLEQPVVKELGAGLTNARPFDIREYQATASEMTTLSRELTRLMQSTDQAAPRILDRSVDRIRGLSNHLFLLGLLFCILVLASIAGVTLAYRMLAKRI